MKSSIIKTGTMLAGFLLAACLSTHAEVKLPAIFSDGMVMQQQTNANLWGTATPHKKVTVTTSWNGKQYAATADKNGAWKLTVATPEAGGPYTVTFDDGTQKTLNNILIGELWLCSGQSNMEMPMKGFKNQPVENANMDILHSKNPQIREANALGVLDGVTTNPSLMAKEGIKGVENQHKHYIEICNIVDGDVSAEVIATDYEGMIREGEELAALNPHIVVKVPCIEDGIKAIKYFSNKGIRTNCTLVFSAGQALLAAKAGATYVSPFVGRLDDICNDGVGLVAQIVELYQTYDYKTQVLAASIRNTLHILQCAEVGADVVTCPLSAIKGLLNHPLTDIGLEKFLADYKKVNG